MHRGATLGVVLCVIGLAVTVSFALASSTVFTLQVVNRNQSSQTATTLAETAIFQAISNLEANPNYGTQKESFAQAADGGGRGSGSTLTFADDPMMSLNNLANAVSVKGVGRTVPPWCVQLIGRGEWLGQTSRVECLLQNRLNNMALGASGPVVSNGPLLISRQQNGDNLPADVVSNSSNSPAITLSSGTTISGNVQAVGTISLPSSGAHIAGVVQPGSAPQQLPAIDVSTLDPAGVPGAVSAGPSLSGSGVSGVVRRDGDLDVPGDLQLNDAIIFATGTVTVHGKVTGTGAILAVHDVSLMGGANLRSDDEVAVVSGGNLTVQGSGPSTSQFQGFLVSSGKTVNVSDIAVDGILVGNHPDGTTMTVQNVKTVAAPNMLTMQFSVTIPGAPGAQGTSLQLTSGGPELLTLPLLNGDTYTGYVEIDNNDGTHGSFVIGANGGGKIANAVGTTVWGGTAASSDLDKMPNDLQTYVLMAASAQFATEGGGGTGGCGGAGAHLCTNMVGQIGCTNQAKGGLAGNRTGTSHGTILVKVKNDKNAIGSRTIASSGDSFMLPYSLNLNQFVLPNETYSILLWQRM